MQFMLVSGGLLAGMIAPVRPADTITVTVLLGVPIALYPGIRRLFERPGLERLSRPLLGLVLLCSPFLLGETVRLVAWQIAGAGGEHATAGHWISSATIPLAVIVAGLMAATRQPGAGALGILAGLSLVYLGGSAMVLPTYDGSWGTRGGAAALVAGIAFVLLTLREARRPAAQARPSRWSSLPRRIKLGIAGVSVLVYAIVFASVMWVGASSPEAGAEELAGLPALATPGFSFDRQEIRAKVGETVAMRFDNTHNAPHSFDIDELNVHVRSEAGQERLIRFQATTAGTYTFYCAIPGHRQAGMEGKLVVKP